MAEAASNTKSSPKENRPGFIDLLKRLLDENQTGGLKWLDRGQNIWQLPWRHHKPTKWGDQDADMLFKFYKLYNTANKFTPDNAPRPDDLKKWKENFRNSLRSLGVKELVKHRNQEGPNPFKVYQFSDEPLGVKKSRRKSPDSVRTVSEINSDASSTGSEGSDDGVLQENMSFLSFRSRSPFRDFSDIETDGFSGDLNGPVMGQALGHNAATYLENVFLPTSGVQNFKSVQSSHPTVRPATQFTAGPLFCNDVNPINITPVSTQAYTTAFAPNGQSVSATAYQNTVSGANGFVLATDSTLQSNKLVNITTGTANAPYQVYNNVDREDLHQYPNGLNGHTNGNNIPAANGFVPAPHLSTCGSAFNIDSNLDLHNPQERNNTEYNSWSEIVAFLDQLDNPNRLSEHANSSNSPANLPLFENLTSMNSDTFPGNMSINAGDLNTRSERRPPETANGANADTLAHFLTLPVSLSLQPCMKIKVNYYCFTALTQDILEPSIKICFVPNDNFRAVSERSPDSFGPLEPIVELPHVTRCPELQPDQMRDIGAILENIKGGVRIRYHKGDIYAKRFSKAVLHHSIPYVTPYKKLNRDEKYEKIFDFNHFKNNISLYPTPYVQLSFSVKEPEKLITQLLSIEIWHLEASRIIQNANPPNTSLFPYEPECSLSNEFDRKLSIAEKMTNSCPA
ncbi:uncharacterized protein LOC131931069 [Physella acuta]|uniref:uncharacterized protein LOC131931069 n=1 Tax=Physella acuta TaxID=109671 RepID=UPI0027DDCDAE|nr:uncharacterized protein LOC131931069 [Physella acuta]